jgi:LysR family glycine cleavage system transcriptional activator
MACALLIDQSSIVVQDCRNSTVLEAQVRLPNLNALRMFEITGRTLNFRLAADEANLTQGAVAQQIRKLESDLEAKLFERQARGLAFTPSGQNFHVAVSRGLAIIDSATQELSSDSGTVVISMPPSFAAKWLVPRLAAFGEQHPEIAIEAIASETLEDFRSTRVDFAIRQARPAPQQGLTIHHLVPVRLVAVCSPQRAARIRQAANVVELLQHPLIEDAHGHWAELISRSSATVKPRILRFNQTALALDAAANGQGIALAPDILTTRDIAEHRLATIWTAPVADDAWFHAVHPRDRRPSVSAIAALDWIATEIE